MIYNDIKTVDISPVGLSTYIRLGHLKKTVEALKKNHLADKTDLFIFSDGPRDGDEEKVCNVRQYLKSITGFKTVQVFEREKNDRVFNNRGGISEILGSYNRIIFLEEDVVTHPVFLSFMNAALKRYESEEKVFSISGWCPKLKKTLPLVRYSTFFVPRFCGWGLGIWKDRFDKITKLNMDNFKILKNNPIAMERIHKQMGKDVLSMIEAEALGKINALDIRCCYHQAMTGELTLYPFPTLTKNIGLDGTGEHCPKQSNEINGDFDELCLNTYTFKNNVTVCPKIAKIYSESFYTKRPVVKFIKKFCLRIGIIKVS